MSEQKELNERIRVLEEQIADVRSRFPAHSLKPALFNEFEELEEQLELLREQQKENETI